MQQYYQVPALKNSDIRRLARKSLKGNWGRAMLPMLIIMLALLLPALVQSWDFMSSGIMNADSPKELQKVMKEISNQEGLLSSVLSFFSFLCGGAFSVAAAFLSVRILRKESYTVSTAFRGFRQFVQAFLIDFLISVFSLLWAMITIVPGTMIFIMSSSSGVLSLIGMLAFAAAVIAYIYLILRYSMAFFIAQDNETLPSLQVVRYSVTLMKGRTAKFFSLQLSFIGWILLAAIPLSAGLVFLDTASQAGSGLLKGISICLMILGFITTTMVQLYLNTADAVFYSAVSGNFGIAGSSGNETSEALPGAQEEVKDIGGVNAPEEVQDGGKGSAEEPVSGFEPESVNGPVAGGDASRESAESISGAAAGQEESE